MKASLRSRGAHSPEKLSFLFQNRLAGEFFSVEVTSLMRDCFFSDWRAVFTGQSKTLDHTLGSFKLTAKANMNGEEP